MAVNGPKNKMWWHANETIISQLNLQCKPVKVKYKGGV